MGATAREDRDHASAEHGHAGHDAELVQERDSQSAEWAAARQRPAERDSRTNSVRACERDRQHADRARALRLGHGASGGVLRTSVRLSVLRLAADAAHRLRHRAHLLQRRLRGVLVGQQQQERD